MADYIEKASPAPHVVYLILDEGGHHTGIAYSGEEAAFRHCESVGGQYQEVTVLEEIVDWARSDESVVDDDWDPEEQ